jgi:hypothetical protein
VNSLSDLRHRTAWTLWAAVALVAVGGVAPFVFGGTSSRIDVVIIPFWMGAVVLGACALLPLQNRSLTALLYFIAGLAIVYGLLSMFSLPVRLAVLGTCQAPPAPCTTGLPRPLTDGENTGMGVAATLGILGILIGFYGLVTVYRRAVIAPTPPPERKIPAVAPAPAVPEPVAVVAVRPEPEPELELPAHEEEELPELPPHESTSATT